MLSGSGVACWPVKRHELPFKDALAFCAVSDGLVSGFLGNPKHQEEACEEEKYEREARSESLERWAWMSAHGLDKDFSGALLPNL